MIINHCRTCSHQFFQEPLLSYENMPKAAQCFPDEASIDGEKGVDLAIFQCAGCGLVQLNNEPVPYYKEVIRAAAFSEEMTSFRKKQFQGFIEKYALQNKKIIEIGCGRGEYLSLLRETNDEAYGLEYSDTSVSDCVKQNLNVVKDFIDNSNHKIKEGPFDAFLMLSFLEHLPDPNSTLQGICHNLTDDAVGIVEVPNFDMILQNNLFSEFIGDHLFYFTRETLKAILERNGFEVIECQDVWHSYIISAIVKKRKKLDILRFYQNQEQLKQQFDDFIARFEGKKIAIWGAGHQALAMISLVGLAGKVKYVVDSATFKQNKYTPATHIPVLAPEALESDPVDAIVVMAASYSDEVVGIIQTKFASTIQIVVLRDFGLEIV